MEFFNDFKVHEIIFFPGSIRISKQNSYGTNLLGVQRGFCSAFPRHSIGCLALPVFEYLGFCYSFKRLNAPADSSGEQLSLSA